MKLFAWMVLVAYMLMAYAPIRSGNSVLATTYLGMGLILFYIFTPRSQPPME